MKNNTVPVMRQAHMIASVMVFGAFILSHYVHPNFIYLALMVGVGTGLSGFTGFCPMVAILEKLPWNKNIKNENGGTSCCH
jgi:hypothetical protein